MKALVVKASGQSKLEEEINKSLNKVGESFVDLKLSGAFDGEEERFVAVILYE